MTESLSGLFGVLVVVTLVLDTLRSYLKRAAQRSASAYGFVGGIVPSEPLARIIVRAALPEMLRARWATPLILGFWLTASVGLLILGTSMYGVIAALAIRIAPWLLGGLFSSVFDWWANPSAHEGYFHIRPMHRRGRA